MMRMKDIVGISITFALFVRRKENDRDDENQIDDDSVLVVSFQSRLSLLSQSTLLEEMSNKVDWKLGRSRSPSTTWTSPISMNHQPSWMYLSSKSSSPCPASIHQSSNLKEVTFWPADSQAYRREINYWPAPVEPVRLRNNHQHQASCGQNHRPLWESPIAIFQAGRSVSHKRQFPELKTKSESMTIILFDQNDRHRSSTSSSSPLSSPIGRTPSSDSSSSLSSSYQSTASSSGSSKIKRPYRNNSSAVAACLYQ